MAKEEYQKEASSGRSRIVSVVKFLASLAAILSLAVAWIQTRNDLQVARDTAREQQTVEALLVEQRNLMATVAAANSHSVFDEATQIAEINEKLSEMAPGLPTAAPPRMEPPASPVPSATTVSISQAREIIVLANNVDNTFTWEEGSPYLTTKYVNEGDVAFIPTGNNHFTKELGVAGYEAHEVRYIAFKIYLIKTEAALLLQVQTRAGSWNHRWGFDGRPVFNGYGWPRLGQMVNLPVGEWIDVKLDLINDLGIKPGEPVIGLAFSSSDGNMVYDRVVLLSSEN